MHATRHPMPRSASDAPWLMAGFAIVLAAGIFVVDTFSPLNFAVAVLYVVVIVTAAGFSSRRGLLLVSAGCLALTLISNWLTHAGMHSLDDPPTLRMLVALAAIVTATILVLRNHAATAALKEQARLLDLTHDAILVRDLDDVVLYWNRGAEELYGWKRDAATGRASTALLDTKFPLPRAAIMRDLMESDRWEGVLVHTRQDGTPATVSSRWSLERNERGQPVSILEINTDITEQTRAREALDRAQAELAHVNRVMTMGELTASIAHEVNQPLAAIVTNAETSLRWLARAEPQIDEARAATERVISDGRRASEVIWRLRSLFRKGGETKARLTLNGVIEDTLPLVERELFSHQISLHSALDPEIPAVTGDRTQLQQVVMNLVVNAIQVMNQQAGSQQADRPHRLTVRTLRQEDGQVRVEVRDTGHGIAADGADRLFDAFFTTKANGMGMGLSICRSIVEAHGGRIWVAETSPEGTTMAFFVSLAAPAP